MEHNKHPFTYSFRIVQIHPISMCQNRMHWAFSTETDYSLGWQRDALFPYL